jgi:hypothetical protein
MRHEAMLGPCVESWLNPLRSLGVWLFSGRVLDRLMLVMNDKQNRWAREQVIGEIEASWMADALRTGQVDPGLAEALSALPALPRRKVLFVRVAQDWNSFLRSIPRHRLVELASTGGRTPVELASTGGRTLAELASVVGRTSGSADPASKPDNPPGTNSVPGPGSAPDEIESFLSAVGVDLSRARDLYTQMGGDPAAQAVNQVPTNFTALTPETLTRLALHAQWQTHATQAVYG